jgi:hypothetical protein
MAENTVVHNSREEVAYKLMQDVFRAEKVALHLEGSTTRDKILSTYYECLQTVIGVKPKP